MKKKKYTCSICGMKLSEESIIRNIGGDKEFCRWCAKKENWKSQADSNCQKCKGEGYTIFFDHHTYPLQHDTEIECPCSCLSQDNSVIDGKFSAYYAIKGVKVDKPNTITTFQKMLSSGGLRIVAGLLSIAMF